MLSTDRREACKPAPLHVWCKSSTIRSRASFWSESCRFSLMSSSFCPAISRTSASKRSPSRRLSSRSRLSARIRSFAASILVLASCLTCSTSERRLSICTCCFSFLDSSCSASASMASVRSNGSVLSPGPCFSSVVPSLSDEPKGRRPPRLPGKCSRTSRVEARRSSASRSWRRSSSMSSAWARTRPRRSWTRAAALDRSCVLMRVSAACEPCKCSAALMMACCCCDRSRGPHCAARASAEASADSNNFPVGPKSAVLQMERQTRGWKSCRGPSTSFWSKAPLSSPRPTEATESQRPGQSSVTQLW
mmetsp:Transcript_4113/g.12818  ORF Transcript_4113/g.12818 Transcript_4113/m.12818 type:complete len:306 (-) Transcript_4113:236-1153(-)